MAITSILGGTFTELTVIRGADIDGETLIVDPDNDRVGIGLLLPKTKLTVEGALTMKEQDGAATSTAAYGQLWIKTATPNELYFTTDAGNDIQLTSGTGPAFVGDITSVVAGTLLDGGGTSGDVTLNVDLTEAAEAGIADGDYILFLDGGATGTQSKEAIADVATLFAGTGLTAASSVIGVDSSQTQITAIGTIATGTWQGTAIASAYLDADTAHLSGSQTFSGAKTFSAAAQFNNTLTIGADDQGYDVILYGDTASANITWDTSEDDLIANGAARIVVPDGQLVLGSTAVSSTAAELNVLDGLNRGHIIVGNASNVPTSLAEGSENQVLTIDSNGDAVWATASSGASALNDLSDVSYSSGDLIITSLDKLTTSASAHDAAGVAVVLQGGSTTAGTTNNIAGGSLTLQGGQGKGTGAGGDIIFQVANAGGAGSSLNSYATAITISDDGSTTFNNNNLYIGKSLWHDGDTDTRLHFFNAGDTIALEAGGVDFIRMIENGASSECVINYGGNANVDLRAAGDTETHLLFVDAGNERVSIGDSTDAPAATLEITNHASAGATGVPLLQLNSNDTDQIALDINAANIDANVIDVVASALTTGGIMKLVSDSNSTSTRTLVEIINDNTAATDTVLMKLQNDAITPAASLIVESSANDPNPLVEIINTFNAADRPPVLKFAKINGAADDYDIAKISFYGENNAGTPEPIEYAQILVEASDIVDGDEGGQITMSVMAGGTAGTAALTEALKIGREDASAAAGYALMLNDGNADLNVRMSSTNNNNMFFMDAGADRVGINKQAATSTFHVKGSFCKEVTNQTGATLTIGETHSVITCDTSSNSVECDLPAISGITGRIYTFIKTHASNSMIIDPNGSEKIYKAASPSGGATITYGDIGSTVTLQCTSIGWVVLSEYVPT